MIIRNPSDDVLKLLIDHGLIIKPKKDRIKLTERGLITSSFVTEITTLNTAMTRINFI